MLTRSRHVRRLTKIEQGIDNSSTSDYNLVIGIITKDTISAYVSSLINDYQLNELLAFVKETYDIKSIKSSLITNVNLIKDRKSIYDGELSDVEDLFARNKIK